MSARRASFAKVALALGLLSAAAAVRSNELAADSFPTAEYRPWTPLQAQGEPAVEPLLSKRYAQRFLGDLRGLATAPAHWDRDAWLHVGLATGAVVGTAWLLDEPIRDSIGHDPNRSYGVVSTIERLGEARNTMALLGAFYVSGLALDDERAKGVALDGLIARIIASRLVTSNLKHAVGRARPSLERGPGQFEPFSGRSEHGSFPSGHATEAFAIASVIASHYPEQSWTRWSAYGLAGVVGVARLKHDRHWASDVLGGALIGSSVGRAVVRLNREQRAAEAEGRATLAVADGGLVLSWSF